MSQIFQSKRRILEYIYVMVWFIFRLAEGQAAHGVYVEVSSY